MTQLYLSIERHLSIELRGLSTELLLSIKLLLSMAPFFSIELLLHCTPENTVFFPTIPDVPSSTRPDYSPSAFPSPSPDRRLLYFFLAPIRSFGSVLNWISKLSSEIPSGVVKLMVSSSFCSPNSNCKLRTTLEYWTLLNMSIKILWSIVLLE